MRLDEVKTERDEDVIEILEQIIKDKSYYVDIQS